MVALLNYSQHLEQKTDNSFTKTITYMGGCEKRHKFTKTLRIGNI